MRLIDADALIDKTDDRYSLGEIGRRERDDIVNALEFATTIEPMQWIPCSERMPPTRQSVILCTKEWTGEGCYWETTEHHVIWKGYRWNTTYWDDEVLAWMPLPEPYKGDKDEN